MLQPKIKAILSRKPAVQNSDTNDYQFKIPRYLIRKGIISPDKRYTIYVVEDD